MATLTFQDAFIRADAGEPGNDWVETAGIFAIENNRLTTDGGLSNNAYRVRRPAGEAALDQVVSLIVDTIPASRVIRVAARYTHSPQAFYYFEVSRTALTIRDVNETNLAQTLWTGGDVAYRCSIAVRDSAGTTYVEGRVALATNPDTVLQTVTYNEAAAVGSGAGALLMPGDGVMSVQQFSVYDFSDNTWPTFSASGGGGQFASAQVYTSGFKAAQVYKSGFRAVQIGG